MGASLGLSPKPTGQKRRLLRSFKTMLTPSKQSLSNQPSSEGQVGVLAKLPIARLGSPATPAAARVSNALAAADLQQQQQLAGLVDYSCAAELKVPAQLPLLQSPAAATPAAAVDKVPTAGTACEQHAAAAPVLIAAAAAVGVTNSCDQCSVMGPSSDHHAAAAMRRAAAAAAHKGADGECAVKSEPSTSVAAAAAVGDASLRDRARIHMAATAAAAAAQNGTYHGDLSIKHEAGTSAAAAAAEGCSSSAVWRGCLRKVSTRFCALEAWDVQPRAAAAGADGYLAGDLSMAVIPQILRADSR